jgi:glycerophosphoryl diester phosphodiesterase
MEIALIIIGSLLLLLFFLYLFANGTKRSKALKRYASHRYAHRGLHSDGVPENSMAAFTLAVEHGFGIEPDVRLSKDKQLVVFHDDTLERVVGIEGRVDEFTAEELGKMKLLGTQEGIPLFDDVLNLVSGQVPLLVEIKEAAGDKEVSTLAAERLSSYKGDFIVESFNPLSLRTFKKKLETVQRGILSHKYYAYEPFRKPLYFLLQCLLLNFLCRPSFVAYDHRHYRSPSLFFTRKLFGALTFAWTVRSEEEEKNATRHGFDTVIFEGYIPEK